MGNIRMYSTKGGRTYDLQYYEEDKLAQAVGPLPPQGLSGARGPVIEIRAESEEEAERKLIEALDSGNF